MCPKYDKETFKLFRLYTPLDLYEITKHLKMSLERTVEKIDKESLVVRVFNKTYFELLKEKTEWFNTVCQMIEAFDL